MKVLPTANDAKQFFSGLGIVGWLLLILAVAAFLFFSIDSIGNRFSSWNAERRIEKAEKRADEAETRARAAETEAAEYKGAAAVYQQQVVEIDKKLQELFYVRPDLQKRTEQARQDVEKIRNSPLRPVSDDMRIRVNELGAKLDRLYPE